MLYKTGGSPNSPQGISVSEHMALLTVVAWRGAGLDGGWGQKTSSVHAYLVWSWDAEFLGGAKVAWGVLHPKI